MPQPYEDPVFRRLARFVESAPPPRAQNGIDDSWIATTTGSVRKENQDRGLLAFVSDGAGQHYTVAIVCDGIGGMVGGAEAATTAIATFATVMIRDRSESVQRTVRRAAEAANLAVYSRFAGRGGTTLSAAVVTSSGDVVISNVGDSRVYGIESNDHIEPLTRDDTLAALLKGREIDEALRHQLLQYVGMGEGIDVHVVTIHRGRFERILITTDGAHYIPSELLRTAVIGSQINAQLVSRILTLSETHGGHDNATALCLPTRVSAPDIYEPGLSVQCISASRTLEFWDLNDRNGRGQAAAALTGAPERPESGAAGANEVRSRGRRRRKKSSPDVPDPTLPLTDQPPQVEIKFPKGD